MDEEPADTEDWPYKCMFCFYSNRLNFLEKFYIHSKIEKATEFSHMPSTPPPPCITPIINILHQSDTFVTTNDPVLTYHDHSESIVYVRVHS